MITLLLGLTTTWGSDWRAKVKEIDKFKIEEIALFVTGLEKKERLELYKLLEQSSLKQIRHTHLREQDMDEEEVNYLKNRWDCQLFNLHPTESSLLALQTTLRSFKDQIYIENTGRKMNASDNQFESIVKESAGLCVDFSHWQDYGIIQKLPGYKHFAELIDKYPIGCAHISAIIDKRDNRVAQVDDPKDFNRHTFRSLDQFDYLKDFVQYLPKYTSLELENSFEEQIKAKAYIEKLLIGSTAKQL
jgi:hypothetical protein